MVIDDDPHYARVIQTNLKAEGYEVLVTGDGQTAIEHAANREPDLVVLARIQALLRRVEIFEQKGYHFVFQTTDTLNNPDQRLPIQD
ncbi:MAG: response regulator [Chloroflexi bacterium]|nr:response regulator [Chloroflexota bacterium]